MAAESLAAIGCFDILIEGPPCKRDHRPALCPLRATAGVIVSCRCPVSPGGEASEPPIVTVGRRHVGRVAAAHVQGSAQRRLHLGITQGSEHPAQPPGTPPTTKVKADMLSRYLPLLARPTWIVRYNRPRTLMVDGVSVTVALLPKCDAAA